MFLLCCVTWTQKYHVSWQNVAPILIRRNTSLNGVQVLENSVIRKKNNPWTCGQDNENRLVEEYCWETTQTAQRSVVAGSVPVWRSSDFNRTPLCQRIRLTTGVPNPDVFKILLTPDLSEPNHCVMWGVSNNNNNNNNNNIYLLQLGCYPVTGYFTCKQNKKFVTTRFKSGGLHEKHVVATWNVGNRLSVCL